MSELTWASKSDCGITITRKASLKLRHCQARAQNKGLNRDSRLQTFPPRRGDTQPELEGAIAAPERHYL